MEPSATLRDWSWLRAARLGIGGGMGAAAALTMRHFYTARFPASIADAAACRADSFFSCGNSALAPVAMVHGVPIGFFGLMLGGLVALGAITPTRALERTTRGVVFLGAVLALALTVYSLVGLRSLCLTCTSYTLLALVAAALFWPGRRAREEAGAYAPSGFSPLAPFAPSLPHLVAFGGATLLGAWGASLYWDARVQARSGDAAARVVHQYFALDTVPPPSVLSPYWTMRSTARFQDAPIRIVEFGDLLCSDCRFFAAQLRRLAPEFPGQINAAFQFFPLETRCNDVVGKNLHPGACDLTYVAAYRPELFPRIHDEVFANFAAAKRNPAWRSALARRYGVEPALTDSATHALVRRIIRTGAEYEQTSTQYAHGIRSTPTIILNGRMIIGTLPDEQMRAIFQAIVDEHLGRGKRFLENWVD